MHFYFSVNSLYSPLECFHDFHSFHQINGSLWTSIWFLMLNQWGGHQCSLPDDSSSLPSGKWCDCVSYSLCIQAQTYYLFAAISFLYRSFSLKLQEPACDWPHYSCLSNPGSMRRKCPGRARDRPRAEPQAAFRGHAAEGRANLCCLKAWRFLPLFITLI